MKVAVAFSRGGHFEEMKRLLPALSGKQILYVTCPGPSTDKLRPAYFLRDTLPNPIVALLSNVVTSLKVMVREAPDVVLSTGADVTIPVCLIGKLMGARVVFVESICRLDSLSFTGRVLRPWADLVLVQWEEMEKKYPGSVQYWGRVL